MLHAFVGNFPHHLKGVRTLLGKYSKRRNVNDALMEPLTRRWQNNFVSMFIFDYVVENY